MGIESAVDFVKADIYTFPLSFHTIFMYILPLTTTWRLPHSFHLLFVSNVAQHDAISTESTIISAITNSNHPSRRFHPAEVGDHSLTNRPIQCDRNDITSCGRRTSTAAMRDQLATSQIRVSFLHGSNMRLSHRGSVTGSNVC